jgi:hypothetical protein
LYNYVSDVLQREKQLKGWQRQWKIDLIEQQSPFCFIGLLEAFLIDPRFGKSGSRVLARDDKNYVQDDKNVRLGLPFVATQGVGGMTKTASKIARLNRFRKRSNMCVSMFAC